jgi:hypothetical protein
VSDRRRLALDPIGDDPEVGRWLAALEDARRRTLRELETVDPAWLDLEPDPLLPSIGSFLYHIALIEADWVANDILGFDDPPEVGVLLPWPDRDADGRLTVVRGLPLDAHLDRLAAVRAYAIHHLRSMAADDFHAARMRPDDDMAPNWVIHHLLQHEAEHRTHIAYLRDRIRFKAG